MVVSVPICVNVIVLVTMVVTYAKCQAMLAEQARVAVKRRGLNECMEQLCQQTQPKHSRGELKVSNRNMGNRKKLF